MTQSKSKRTAFGVLFACCCLQFAANGICMGTAGTYMTYVAEAMGTPLSAISLYITVQGIVTMLTVPLIGRLMNTSMRRWVATLAMLAEVVGYTLLGVWDSPMGFYVSGAIIGLGGACITYTAVPLFVNSWFKTNVGTYLGIAVVWPGVAQMIFQPMVTNLCVSVGYQNTYFIMGAVAFVIGVIPAAIFLRNDPAQYQMEAYGSGQQAVSPQSAVAVKGMDAQSVYKSSLFVPLLIATFCFAYCMSISSLTSTFARTSGALSAANAGYAGTALAVGMIIGKFLIGKMFDKLPFGTSTIVFCVIQFIACIGFVFVYQFPTPALVLGLITLDGCAVGATGTVAIPYIVRATYGSKHYSSFYPKFTIVSGATPALCGFFNNWIQDVTGRLTIVFMLMCVFSVIGIIIVGIAQKRNAEMKAQWQ